MDPAKLTVNQHLERWLAHIRTNLPARTVARYAALLRDHVRPSFGARPLAADRSQPRPRHLTTGATPTVVALAPEQVAVLLDAADHSPSPWLGPWTVLAAATGARNGELCGLEWTDLDLDAGTIRFRQALTIVDPTILPDAAPATASATAALVAAAGARSSPWGR